MTAGDSPADPLGPGSRRLAPERLRRPWLLIAAALALAVLSTVLWVKWADSRGRVRLLEAELKQVYAEAETIRLQAARAQERLAQLEERVRLLEAERASQAPRPARAPGRPRPR